jgi:hypothetical protein
MRDMRETGSLMERSARYALALLALLSVAPLLAWVYRLGAFSTWYWWVTVPAIAVLAAAAIVTACSSRHIAIHQALVAGTVGGLVGTIGYDVFRLPFLLAGLRLLAPIDSYGVLMLDAVGSSGRTGMAGWVFHATNGICFGIAYALVAAGRHWGWALAWAMLLETATVATPFVTLYGLSTKPWLIVIAYLAHVPYGLAVGFASRQPAVTVSALQDFAPRFGTTIVLVATVAVLLAWQRPWATSAILAEGEAVAPGPSAVVHGADRLSPSWIRVPVGGCAAIRNSTAAAITFDGAQIPANSTGQVCFQHAAVKRVKIGSRDWSGGFVIVDPEMHR